MTDPDTRKHVLLIGASAFGHATPLLELGKKLAPFHEVTYAAFEHFIPAMKTAGMIPTDPPINIIDIPSGYVDVVTEKPMARFSRMLDFMDSGTTNFYQNIVPFTGHNPASSADPIFSQSVDVVICDDMYASSLPVLYEMGVPFYSFNTGASARMLHYLSVTKDAPTVSDDEPWKSPFLAIPPDGDHPPPMTVTVKRCLFPMRPAVPLAKGVIANTVYELEPHLVEAIKKHPLMKGVSLYNVGPLTSVEKVKENEAELQKKVKIWLDEKAEKSVIYVAFGSMGSMKLLHERHIPKIVEGLLATGQPFVYALSENYHVDLPEEIQMGIASQFEDKNRPFLVLSWAPQKMILEHSATGVFLSHCGWNSTIEALTSGVPIVAWPLVNDMMVNAQEVVKKGAGVLIDGAGRFADKDVSAEEVSDALVKVGGFRDGTGGENLYHGAAKKWKQILEDAAGEHGTSQADFRRLVNDMSRL